MRFRLVRTDAFGNEEAIDLAGEVSIGRDTSCEVPISHPDVSWRHALIQREDDQFVFFDLGSTNGSTVNGELVTEPRVLDAGDQIVLAGVALLRVEEASVPWRVPAALAASALALLGVVALLVVALSGGEPENPALAEATALAEQGIAAARAGDADRARELLKEAAGRLYTGGLLDEVPRGELQRSAMQLLQGHLDVSFDLWSYYDKVLRVPPPPPAPVERLCDLERAPSDQLEPCLREWIREVLVGIHQDPESVPHDFHREVGVFLREKNDFLARSIERGRYLVPMFRRELEAAKMPPLLHYLALIESGYVNAATSNKGAAGVWQIMPATGRQYGLRVDDAVDERRDPAKATRAAARYLRDLTFEFGGNALLLSLASYNRGENGVRRSLKRLDDPFSDRSYWRLVERDLLPQQTQEYVPRFIAAAIAGEGGLPSPNALAQAGY